MTSIEALYPFLYATSGDLQSVLAAVRQSTVDKTREITALRHALFARDGDRLLACAHDLAVAFATGARLLAFGNGGSCTDAQDVATLFMHPGGGRRPLPAIALTSDVAVVTALSNDVGFEVVFARQIAAFGRPGDIALGLSTSGNSENLVRAFDEAARRGLRTVGLAGGQGGVMAELDTIDHLFVVPSASVHRIQEAQTTLYHVLWQLVVDQLPARRDLPTHGDPGSRPAARVRHLPGGEV
ncbi:phosphoheptose isomerase [Longispora fulva]|uniref:D-sedoheptulose 7-phosphate isomerase n=1 Tax=Longispora fulva TaxID=619741 RepID=A0A8J7GBP7_9ACTN|nr:SIS domain-containing protein [Longispora fulva]MBG6135485.1 D-sedoheptulose 7-phosphate isomerase [Longispora fulva]GIG56274.1 phosphoheptose isomerase [Longispora fulva]